MTPFLNLGLNRLNSISHKQKTDKSCLLTCFIGIKRKRTTEPRIEKRKARTTKSRIEKRKAKAMLFVPFFSLLLRCK